MKSQVFAALLCAATVAPASGEIRTATWLGGNFSPDTYLGAIPARMVDGSGLSDPALAGEGASLAALSGVTHAFGDGFLDSWVTNGFADDYFASQSAPVLFFDLGEDVWLRSLVLWQYENSGGGFARSGNAARTVEVRVATSADGLSFPAAAAATLTLKNVDLDLGGVNAAQIFSLGAGVKARYVRLTVTDNYFGVPGIVAGGDRVGLGEIRFNVTNGARTVVAGAPNAFELRSANSVATVLTAIDSGFNPWGLALDPDGERVFWSDPVAGGIGWTGFGSRDGQGGLLIAPPGRVLHGIDLDCENGILYVLDSALDALLRIDLDTLFLTTLRAGLFVRPNAIDHDPTDGTLAVTDSGNDTVYLLDTGGNVLHSWKSPSSVGAWGVACDPDSDLVYFTSHDRGELIAWHPANGSIATVTTGLDRPRGLEFDRSGRLFCLESGNGGIVGIDPATGGITPIGLGGASGGRDLVLFNADDADGDFLPDPWERGQGFALCGMGAASDPNRDGESAFNEMLFNGSPTGGGGAPGSLEWLPGGGALEVRFETIAFEDYAFTLLVSEDLQSWRPSVAVPTFGASASAFHQSRTYVISPEAEGFTRRGIFTQLIGSASNAPE